MPNAVARSSALLLWTLIPAFFPTFPRLAAQDVAVGNPVWLGDYPAPASLSVFKDGIDPAYPPEMKGSGSIGYATVERFITRDGHWLDLSTQATLAPFQEATQEGDSLHPGVWDSAIWIWELGPKVIEAFPLQSYVWIPVIFNPASASIGNADATPRLLAVSPIIVRLRHLETAVVHVRVSLDSLGNVLQVTQPTPAAYKVYLPYIERNLHRWKFAPARKQGHSAPAEIDLPVLLQPLSAGAYFDHLPKVLRFGAVKYPESMARSGVRGDVLISCIVDEQGHALDPFVFGSNNPAFNENAIRATLGTRFRPGVLKGRAVNTEIILPISFHIDPADQGVYAISAGGDFSDPKNRGAKLGNALAPVYPFALLRDGVSGGAMAMMLVNTEGRVIALKSLDATRPEFEKALEAALEGFTYSPAMVDGEPALAKVRDEVDFRPEDISNPEILAALDLEKKHPSSIHAPRELDRPLALISQSQALYPLSQLKAAKAGNAVVEFLVNEKGNVCLPRVVTASTEDFGYSAVQAVSAWIFEPPSVGGKPCVVRIRQSIDFKPPDASLFDP